MKKAIWMFSCLFFYVGLNAQVSQKYFEGVGLDGKQYQSWFLFPSDDHACHFFGILGTIEDEFYMSTSLEEKERETYMLYLPEFVPVVVFWKENQLKCFKIGEGFSLNPLVDLAEKEPPFFWEYQSLFAERKDDPVAIEMGGLNEIDRPNCRTWIHGKNIVQTPPISDKIAVIQDSLMAEIHSDFLLKRKAISEIAMESGTEWDYSIFPCRFSVDRITFLCREDKTICGKGMMEYYEKYVHFNLKNGAQVRFKDQILDKENLVLELLQKSYSVLLQSERFSLLDAPMEVFITDNYFLLENDMVFVYQPGEIAPPEESIVYLHVSKQELKDIGIDIYQF